MAGRLLSLLTQAPQLIVSLPENSSELARAAADAGANALKVHLHVKHEASGTEFGSLDQERAELEEILSVGVPTGVVPGSAGRLPSRREMSELAAMGMDFFDLFARDMPAWMTSFGGMTRVAAIDETTDLDAISNLETLGIEMIEAAVVSPDGYGLPLSPTDLATYRSIRRATTLPIIVPTERAIRPDEVGLLVREIGINAVMIGAIVTGRRATSLRASTERFATALAAQRD